MGQVYAPGGAVLVYRNDTNVHHFTSENELLAYVLAKTPLDVLISEANAVLSSRADIGVLSGRTLEAFREMCDREIDRRNLQKLKGTT